MYLRFSIIKVVAVTTLLALIAGCGQEQSTAPQMPPPAVGVVVAQPTTLNLTTDLPGRTVAYRLAEVRPQVNGIIKKRLFEEGSYVEEGQLLYQIDDAKYKAEYQRTQATLNNAERLAKRYKELKKTNAVSQQQYDDAMAALDLAQAEAEIAKIDLDYTRIVAPISGKIGRSSASEGALVTDGQNLSMATIQQVDPIYVDINQPVKQLYRLREQMESGQLTVSEDEHAKVRLLLESGQVFEHPGMLKFSEVSVNEGTGSVALRAVFPNPEGKLLPGMFVKTRLHSGQRDNVYLVPQQGVQRDLQGNPIAWVVNDSDQVEIKTLTAEQSVGNQWLVTSGLVNGDRVVTEGLFMLRPGVPVTVTPASNVAPDTDLTDGNEKAQESDVQTTADTDKS